MFWKGTGLNRSTIKHHKSCNLVFWKQPNYCNSKKTSFLNQSIRFRLCFFSSCNLPVISSAGWVERRGQVMPRLSRCPEPFTNMVELTGKCGLRVFQPQTVYKLFTLNCCFWKEQRNEFWGTARRWRIGAAKTHLSLCQGASNIQLFGQVGQVKSVIVRLICHQFGSIHKPTWLWGRRRLNILQSCSGLGWTCQRVCDEFGVIFWKNLHFKKLTGNSFQDRSWNDSGGPDCKMSRCCLGQKV